MEEKLRSTFGFWVFTFVVLFLLIGGFFFTKEMLKEEKNDTNEIVDKEELKIDKDKDYIYYINEKEISHDAEIGYKDVVINLTTQEDLSNSLKRENEMLLSNIMYIKDQKLVSKDIIRYDNDGIYSLTFRVYKDYEYDKYISLLVEEYSYSCFDGITFNKSRSYVFNKDDGNILEYEELLSAFNVSLDDVKEAVRTNLKNKKTSTINIDETLNNINTSGIFVNDSGHLAISYLVKTSETNYNDVTEVIK